MTAIATVVNIGPVLTADLARAGITTLDQLRALGYREAARRVRSARPDRDCAHKMLALAGAVAGVRWAALPASTRARIRAEAREDRSA